MITQPFDYTEPTCIKDAFDLKRRYPSSVFMGGGTDVVPLMKYDLLFPDVVISLQKIPELGGISVENGNLIIGAMTKLHELALYGKANPALTGIGRAAQLVASPQIRRIGTVAGNLLQSSRCYYFNQTASWRQAIQTCIKVGGDVCHQAPARDYCCALYYSDLAPALLAAGATAHIYNGGGAAAMPLAELLENPSALCDSILTHVSVPDIADLKAVYFRKRAVRAAIDFPLANAALAVRKNAPSRLIMGAMTPVPVSLKETAARITGFIETGSPFPADLYETAIAEAKSKMRPIKEATVSAPVKQKAMAVVQEVIRDLDL